MNYRQAIALKIVAACLAAALASIEWGRSRASTPFHPPYDEMRKVMREVTAGLLELCLSAAKETRRT